MHCTRLGEHGSPLHYFGNYGSFIRFISIIVFVSLLGGRPMNAPTDTHILLYIIWSGNTDFHFAIHIPDHNFQLSIFNFQFNKQVWRNWQTRMVQVHVKAISCRFKSCYLHHTAVSYAGTAVLYHIFGLFYGDFQII